jgi:hypothetical protein
MEAIPRNAASFRHSTSGMTLAIAFIQRMNGAASVRSQSSTRPPSARTKRDFRHCSPSLSYPPDALGAGAIRDIPLVEVSAAG